MELATRLETPRLLGVTLVALGAATALALAGVGVLAVASTAVGRGVNSGPPIKLVVQARDAVLVPIPGGKVRIGDDTAGADERPSFDYHARPLLMDRTPVTVAQFGRFVAETGYVTDAERRGSSDVLDARYGGWVSVDGANWKRPRGPGGPAAPRNHPVTQVSWRDADIFCRSYGARLPTELEWERAALLGQTADGHVFRAGDSLQRRGRYMANVWQGVFPLLDTGDDGYRATSPVGAFGAAPSGLTDMAGNVWQWTTSAYRPYGRGPDARPARIGDEQVQRGGSFLCDPGFCQGFRVTSRGHATADASFPHVSFRCVVDPGRIAATAGRVAGEGRTRLSGR